MSTCWLSLFPSHVSGGVEVYNTSFGCLELSLEIGIQVRIPSFGVVWKLGPELGYNSVRSARIPSLGMVRFRPQSIRIVLETKGYRFASSRSSERSAAAAEKGELACAIPVLSPPSSHLSTSLPPSPSSPILSAGPNPSSNPGRPQGGAGGRGRRQRKVASPWPSPTRASYPAPLPHPFLSLQPCFWNFQVPNQ
jgi:hypothetical protein